MLKQLTPTQLLFVRNLLLTTVLGGIIGVLNYLFNIFVARYTDQNIFSIFSAAMGIIYLIQMPALSIQSLVTKQIAQNKDKDLNHYKWYSLFVFTILGILFSLAFFFSKDVISQVASIPTEIVLFLALTMLFAFISPISKGLLLGEEKIVTVNLVLLAETILKFVIGGIAIYYGGIIWALILANSVPAIITTIFILPFVKFKKTTETKVKINFKELILITVSFLLLTVPFSIDLILVNSSFRAEYSAVALLGKLVYFAAITSAAVMFARLTNENVSKNQTKSLVISLGLSGGIGLTLSLIFFLFPHLVISFTVGEQYLMVEKYIGVFGLCMTGFALVYMTANYFISKGYYKYLFILFFTSILQVLLFTFRNDSLEVVIQNQVITYVVLVVLTFLFLLFKLNSSKKNGREES
ncbi:MAG: MATE family efflux transporter [Candidatus Dojkabacteria bacterium]